MTLDSLPDLDTSGLCLVKTLSTALTCWPYRNTALRCSRRFTPSLQARMRHPSTFSSQTQPSRWNGCGTRVASMGTTDGNVYDRVTSCPRGQNPGTSPSTTTSHHARMESRHHAW